MPDTPDRTAITRLIVNARVETGDPRRPWADAVALAGDRVVAAGSSAELRKLAPAEVPVVDARGTVLRITNGRVA
jgi:predicted amidohydrolase YtcJ